MAGRLDETWKFVELLDAAIVDVPDGILVASDWSWLPEVEDTAWRVEVPPGSYLCRVALASHPLQEPVAAAIELVVTDAPVASWVPLPEPNEGGAYVPENTGFGFFSLQWIYEVILDEDRLDNFEHLELVSDTTHDFTEIDHNGSRAFYMWCPLQHPDITSWRGRDEAGQTVKIVSSLEVLDIDPVRDGHLPWD